MRLEGDPTPNEAGHLGLPVTILARRDVGKPQRGSADPFFRVCGFSIFVGQEPHTFERRSALRLLANPKSNCRDSSRRQVRAQNDRHSQQTAGPE